MSDSPSTGMRIAPRIVTALCGRGLGDYETISRIVYAECRAIALEQQLGDWLEMPNGDTYTLSFKPAPHQGATPCP